LNLPLGSALRAGARRALGSARSAASRQLPPRPGSPTVYQQYKLQEQIKDIIIIHVDHQYTVQINDIYLYIYLSIYL
jgi:hypothetical protein